MSVRQNRGFEIDQRAVLDYGRMCVIYLTRLPMIEFRHVAKTGN